MSILERKHTKEIKIET